MKPARKAVLEGFLRDRNSRDRNPRKRIPSHVALDGERERRGREAALQGFSRDRNPRERKSILRG